VNFESDFIIFQLSETSLQGSHSSMCTLVCCVLCIQVVVSSLILLALFMRDVCLLCNIFGHVYVTTIYTREVPTDRTIFFIVLQCSSNFSLLPCKHVRAHALQDARCPRVLAKFHYAIWSQIGPQLVADLQRAEIWPVI